MVNTQKGKSQLPITVKAGFSEIFLFSEITFWEKKTLTSLDNYLTYLLPTGTTFQSKRKVLDTIQLVDFTTRVLSSKNFTITRVWAQTSWLPGRSLHAQDLLSDRPEAMTKHKLVIPTKGIMILVFWEKSFKSMEADYSNHLASSLVASSRETSPSSRIRLWQD